MGYKIALVVGVIIGFVGIGGLCAIAMDVGPRGGPGGNPGPLGAAIPLIISAVLISISILGLRKRKKPENVDDDTDLDDDKID